MSRVEQIEAEIEKLPADEFHQIVEWLRIRSQATWDSKLDCDSSSGDLDFLFEEAESVWRDRTAPDWPPSY